MFTNPRYVNENGGILLTQADGVDLYVDDGHYYQEAIAGRYGEIKPYTPIVQPTPDPRAAMVCSPVQMRIALLEMGLLDSVALIAASNTKAAIAWEFATSIRRLSPFIESLGVANGFTPEQIDDIFVKAMEVDV